jgi:hypothetical protein
MRCRQVVTSQPSLPLDTPAQPAFNREKFKHEIKVLAENLGYDDIYNLNTQSGTQWDGFRHVRRAYVVHEANANTYQFAHFASGTFYNGASNPSHITNDWR